MKLRILALLLICLLSFIQPAYASASQINYLPISSVPSIFRLMRSCSTLTGEQGIEACNMAIYLNPDNVILWNNRGEKLFSLGRYFEALSSYNHALLIDSESSLVLANRCGVLSQLERHLEALKSCDLALKGNQEWGKSGEVLVWNNKGNALFNLGRYEEALVSFNTGISINPNYKSIQYNREAVLLKLEQLNQNDSYSSKITYKNVL